MQIYIYIYLHIHMYIYNFIFKCIYFFFKYIYIHTFIHHTQYKYIIRCQCLDIATPGGRQQVLHHSAARLRAGGLWAEKSSGNGGFPRGVPPTLW